MIQFGDLRYFISCTLAVFHKTLLSSSTFGTERNPLKINKEFTFGYFPTQLKIFRAPLKSGLERKRKKVEFWFFFFFLKFYHSTLTRHNIIRRQNTRRLLKNMFLFHFSLPFEAKKESKILSFAVSLFTRY